MDHSLSFNFLIRLDFHSLIISFRLDQLWVPFITIILVPIIPYHYLSTPFPFSLFPHPLLFYQL